MSNEIDISSIPERHYDPDALIMEMSESNWKPRDWSVLMTAEEQRAMSPQDHRDADAHFSGFDRLSSVPDEIYECGACGALVSNWHSHNNWHEGPR